ncbi:unnamed protein product [Cuscuta campestris]|uniref:Dof zinc finger protein n=1 Tax=Cuscuta campestris TaxID=132261 RepID=A0A484NQT0_9ASTE|nr:unnamed protein product [Cuscuta campestris]
MAFSSFSIYLDQSNLQLQPYNQQESGVENPQVLSPPPLPAPAQVGAGGEHGSIRPGSMVDRARLARVPLPENGLKCPRCESTSTKFCYFNNYSLMQPRHFCKTCRRYWTRGGAMRNVPVGGGCRRNKRRKSGAKPDGGTATPEKQSGFNLVGENSSISGGGGVGGGGGGACPITSGNVEISGKFSTHELPPLLTSTAFQAGLSHYGRSGGNIGSSAGRSFLLAPQLAAYENNNIAFNNNDNNNNNNNNTHFISTGEAEPWRFLGSLTGFEPPPPPSTDLFAIQGGGTLTPSGRVEESQGLNSNYPTRLLLGNMENNQYWVGGSGGGGVSNSSWTGGYSGHFNSSSTGHRLL